MAEPAPVTELRRLQQPACDTFGLVHRASGIGEGRTYWIATVRPDGRPHVHYSWRLARRGDVFCTGSDERKAKNLAEKSTLCPPTWTEHP